MNFLELQNAVIYNRFNAGMRATVKRWLTAEYAFVWHHADWSFKRVNAFESDSEITVTAGDRTPAMPSAFGSAILLLNDDGAELPRLDPTEFERRYRDPDADQGEPQAWAIINGQLYLGPTPSEAATFYLAHKRDLSHLHEGGAATAGKMVEDTDEPVWPEDHHELLIAGARARGKKREQDPTWQADEEERNALLLTMLADEAMLSSSVAAYGRDPL